MNLLYVLQHEAYNVQAMVYLQQFSLQWYTRNGTFHSMEITITSLHMRFHISFYNSQMKGESRLKIDRTIKGLQVR